MQPRVLAIALVLACLAPIARAGEAETARAERWFVAHRARPPLLRNFLQRMPKGADLHSHLSGAVYAETYLKLAADSGWCVDSEKLRFAAPPCATGSVPAAGLPAATYGAMVDRLSTRNVEFSGHSGHDQFFASFGQFGAISGLPSSFAPMLAEATERAAGENVEHLELMVTFQSDAVRALGAELPWAAEADFAKRRQWLLDHGLARLVAAGRQDIDAVTAAYDQALRCGKPAARPGCAVDVRWLQQTTRTGAPEQVFAQLAYAFELARADKRVAGINLVAPEDDPVALRDYRLQMEMIGFLSKQSPGVKVALHAGELALGLVPPEDLRNHIHDALFVAGAKRIGHGVDIGYEDDAGKTLAAMKQHRVAVEICLTSNDLILGVKGAAHPLPDYLAAGVPVVLGSDDEGVSRIDLSNEYLRAAQTYRLDYRKLKQISRDSLEYSFLPGASLWRDSNRALPAAPCAKDTIGADTASQACYDYLNGSEKAARQWRLESAFEKFESSPEWGSARVRDHPSSGARRR
jgi:adenosine deaminase